MSRKCFLSIIVPVGPGETEWDRLTDSILPLPAKTELLLVFSSKTDAVKGASKGPVVTSLVCPGSPQRARAMNFGADKANGELIWFLHADSHLHKDTVEMLVNRSSCLQDGIWYFDLVFRRDGPWQMRLNQLGVWIRSRLLRMPFGDQGFLMTKSTFNKLGGFPEDAEYGEDHLLVWKARQRKIAVKSLGFPIYTSARKYQERGWFKTTMKHVYLTWRQALPELLKMIFGSRS